MAEIVKRFSAHTGQTPGHVQLDNGSELISKAFAHWANENAVTLDFSRSGEPSNNRCD